MDADDRGTDGCVCTTTSCATVIANGVPPAEYGKLPKRLFVKIGGKPDCFDDCPSNTKRFLSYRLLHEKLRASGGWQDGVWKEAQLASADRVPLPACVVAAVRRRWTEPVAVAGAGAARED